MNELFVTLAVFPLVGTATIALLRIPLPSARASRFAFSFLTGAGANGVLLYLLGVMGLPLRIGTFISILVLAAIIVAVRWRAVVTLGIA